MAGALKALERAFTPTQEWDDQDRLDYPDDRQLLEDLYLKLERWDSCSCEDCSDRLRDILHSE